jgi:cytoskeletal protein RodZ
MRDKSILGVRTWRLEHNITLESIAEATKIGVRLLEAIERGDFKRLPGGIYDTNYIRQYARAIDFSEAELLAAYHASCRGDAPALVMSYS